MPNQSLTYLLGVYLKSSELRTNRTLIFPALNTKSENERCTNYFPNYKTMEYSLVREKPVYLRLLKLEREDGGRPDGMSGKVLTMCKC